MSKDLWYEDGKNRHRIVAIDYYHRKPCNVLTEEHWDHSQCAWFDPSRDKPNGTCPNFWDFSWSRADKTLYFHQSGGGGELRFCIGEFVKKTPPPGLIWVAEGVPLVVCGSKKDRIITTDAQLLKLGYRRLKKPLMLLGESRNPFEVGQEGETIWCDICKDDLYEEGWNDPCKHMTWCEGCSDYVYIKSRKTVRDSGVCTCTPEED